MPHEKCRPITWLSFLKKKKKLKQIKVFFHSDCFCKHIFIYFIMFYSQALEKF